MVSELLLGFARFQRAAVSHDLDRSSLCSCGFALESQAGQVYNEEAFRHFLDIEQRRAERSGRSFLLALVSLRKLEAADGVISQDIAGRVFAGLEQSVREVDFVGWFREDRIAGAVLAQGLGELGTEAKQRIAGRVTRDICGRLPSNVAQRLHVRVAQLRGGVKC